MSTSGEFLSPSEAARRLGVSAKALRIYEQRGLLAPRRSAAGWRVYGPQEMRRAREVVALRALGFSLAQIARVQDKDPEGLEAALAAHQATLEGQARNIAATVERVRRLRAELAGGHVPAPAQPAAVSFALPWPWDGERFALGEIRPLTYVVGPLFSGKTRLLRRIAEEIPNAAFIGLERLADGGAAARVQLAADPALASRVEQALAWLVEDGAARSNALIALLAGLEDEGPDALVVDMIEQGLDAAAQAAVVAHLRRRAGPRPLFMTTRSSEILDLAAVGAGEAILLCPANHSPPVRIDPYPGAPGYEAVATCLASPEVRARTAGMIAWRPPEPARN